MKEFIICIVCKQTSHQDVSYENKNKFEGITGVLHNCPEVNMNSKEYMQKVLTNPEENDKNKQNFVFVECKPYVHFDCMKEEGWTYKCPKCGKILKKYN